MIDFEEQFNFTNKLKHPSNAMKVVYRHFNKEQAEYMATLLVDAGIDFEVEVDEEDERKPTYFGVSRSKEAEVDKLNFIAIGKNRAKFIADPIVRWMIIVLSVMVLTMAIVGALNG